MSRRIARPDLPMSGSDDTDRLREIKGKGREVEKEERKGKCGSVQSKPCHMFQSAGICPPVQTRMLRKKLLIH